MAAIDRNGLINFGDASINIIEEPVWMKWKDREVWTKKFRKDVFKRVIQQMNRLGWVVREWEDAEDFKAIAKDRRTCQKGDLWAEISISYRSVNIEMWQDVANIDREDGKGKYVFKKEERMPYLLRLEMERTRRRLRDYLCNVFAGYEFKAHVGDARSSKRGPGHLTALEWVDQAQRTSGHYDAELGHAPINMACNARSADGGTITQGARIYAINYDKRVITGIAYYNLNNMWWVVTGKYGVNNLSAGEIYLEPPGDLKRKRNSIRRRKRLEIEMAKAIRAMDFMRAETLKQILFPTSEPLYLIWHKDHGKYHGPSACGYTSDALEAGKFTWEELGRFRPDDGSMEDGLSKIIPLGGEAQPTT